MTCFGLGRAGCKSRSVGLQATAATRVRGMPHELQAPECRTPFCERGANTETNESTNAVSAVSGGPQLNPY